MEASFSILRRNTNPSLQNSQPKRVRSRTSSRPSPYPQSHINKTSMMAENQRPMSVFKDNGPALPTSDAPTPRSTTKVLQSVWNPNVDANPKGTIEPNKTPKVAPSFDALQPFSPLVIDINTSDADITKPSLNAARPRVGSNARRTALGWSKRSNGPKTSTGPGKENASVTRMTKSSSSGGNLMTPGDNLPLSRPRPKTRATLASTAYLIRV